MKNLLIIGNSPLPNENTKSRPAAGLRSFQFLSPLLSLNLNILLINIAMPECYEEEPEYKEVENSETFKEITISKNDPALVSKIQKIHDDFGPEALLSVNTYPSYIASQLKSTAAFWADLNGWAMAEAQAQAFKKNSNTYIPHYAKMENEIISRADKFSVVSEAQKYALTGELALIGRLNKETFNYKFVKVIVNGTEWFLNEEEVLNEEANNYQIPVPDDAFTVLWMGGYNTWVDEKTLFNGLEKAMKECKQLYFISTGGEIKGLDNKTFSNFKKLIDESEYKDRFKFLGWVETKNIPYIYKKADIGINVDRKCMETFTGARNRINEMMKFGLPVLTTLGTEISYEIVRFSAGVGVKSGRPELLSNALIDMYRGRNSQQFLEYSQNGQNYIKENCNYKETLKPLIRWLENPRSAPDRNVIVNFGKAGLFKAAVLYIKENGLKKFAKKLIQKFKK